MRKQELFLLIGIIVLFAVIFLVFLITSIFAPAQPDGLPKPSSTPIKSIRPLGSFNPSLSPQQSILPAPSLPGEIAKEHLINSLPYISPLFDIEYLSQGDIFAVTIKQNPYLTNKALVEQWFSAQGINPEELNISWNIYPEVER